MHFLGIISILNLNSNSDNRNVKEMQYNIIMFLFCSMTAIVIAYTLSDIRNIYGQSDINNSCIILGESNPPPPFVVLRWDTSGQCDSTVDHFVNFYDIRSVVTNGTGYTLFLESE
ncbi:hypothetical protein BH23THE1_BH23THE1_30530 [soil metagenome]